MSTQPSLNNLGIVYLRINDLQNAEKIFKRSIRISESNKIIIAEIGKSYDYLGTVCQKRGLARDSGKYYKKSMDIFQKVSAKKEFSDTLNNLSKLYLDQRRYNEVEPLLKESVKLTKELDGINHPSYAQSLNNLSVFYKNINEYKKAEKYSLQTINLFDITFGVYQSEYLNSLNNFVVIYMQQNWYKEALALVRQTIANKNADINTALYVLYEAQLSGLIEEKEAIINSYEIMQLSNSTSAADVVNRFSRRFSTKKLN